MVANYEICTWLAKQGVQKTEPMNLGGGIPLPFGRVQMTIAHHSSQLPDGSDGGNPGGFLLSLPAGKIYIAADTALVSTRWSRSARGHRAGDPADRRSFHHGP